ncbi:hypothetical protein SUGI_0792010 [Cryptomeria japonica]|nr:hypothetical protein SUGI_0792010 [Cryptomeria japonica]
MKKPVTIVDEVRELDTLLARAEQNEEKKPKKYSRIVEEFRGSASNMEEQLEIKVKKKRQLKEENKQLIDYIHRMSSRQEEDAPPPLQILSKEIVEGAEEPRIIAQPLRHGSRILFSKLVPSLMMKVYKNEIKRSNKKVGTKQEREEIELDQVKKLRLYASDLAAKNKELLPCNLRITWNEEVRMENLENLNNYVITLESNMEIMMKNQNQMRHYQDCLSTQGAHRPRLVLYGVD